MAFKCQRWTIANILPVGFMMGMIAVIWFLYSWLHILPLLRGDLGRWACGDKHGPSKACLDSAFFRGSVEAFIQNLFTLLLVICFGRAITTDPGSVPDEPEWLPEYHVAKRGPEEVGLRSEGDNAKQRKPPVAHEVKHTGARRFCKWCNRFKPDRSHHCRVCRSCILRMDHHCPWIANCVGFRNHKYFFLLVMYSLLDCFFVIATISESLYRSVVDETEFMHRFLLVFCITLASMMGMLLTLFFSFHFWLMLRATSTIEFCEKTYRHAGCSHRGSTKSIYDRGPLENIRAVLGPSILTWFLPFEPPAGDGLSFKVSTDATQDDESDSETTSLLSKSKRATNAGPRNPGSSDGVSTDDNLEKSGTLEHDPSRNVSTPPEVTGASQSIS